MTAPDHKAVSEAVIDLRDQIIEQQSAELEKLRQRCETAEADAATERALQRAAKELPEGWIVRVEVERGAGWVDLHDPSGAFTVQGLIDADDTLAAAIYRAIDRAGGGERENGDG
jgi:hypothetical protein